MLNNVNVSKYNYFTTRRTYTGSKKMKLEVRHASAATKFRLLMWKNFLQQWRHRMQTAAELLLPVLTMTLVLILRWQIAPSERDTLTYPSLPAHTLNYSVRVL